MQAVPYVLAFAAGIFCGGLIFSKGFRADIWERFKKLLPHKKKPDTAWTGKTSPPPDVEAARAALKAAGYNVRKKRK